MTSRDFWEGQAADRLDDLLDGLVRGGNRVSANSALLAPALRLQAMDVVDTEPDPSSHFLDHLERSLRLRSVRSASARQALGLGVHRPASRIRSRQPSVRLRSRAKQQIPFVRAIPAVIAALFLVALSFSAVIVRQQRDDRPSLPLAAIQEANPTSTAVLAASTPTAEPTPAGSYDEIAGAVDIAECEASARQSGTVFGLIGSATTVENVLPLPTNLDGVNRGPTPEQVDQFMAELPAPSQEESDGIEATLRQLTACRFTIINPFSLPANFSEYDRFDDYDGPFYSLFSDDFFRRGLQSWGDGSEPPVLASGWIPNGPIPPSVVDARELPDGRLVALIQDSAQPPAFMIGPNLVLVFTLENGQWHVDELTQVQLPRVAEQTPAATAEGRSVYLEIPLHDDGGRIWDAPTTMGTYRAGTNVIVTVANLGTLPQRFEASALGIVVYVPPGHSVGFTMTAGAGSYRYASFVTSNGQDTQVMEGTFRFVPPGTTIPMG